MVGAVTACFVGPARSFAEPSPAETRPPLSWPSTPVVSPRLEGWAHGLRLHGADRLQTNLALALTLPSRGTYPLGSPDPSADVWGPGRCPRAVIVVAADRPADAITASALSDPTGRSSEPYLQRTASAIPSLYPVGEYVRVDTDQAPVIVTRAARQGATGLSVTAQRALTELRRGRCTTARQAIVVGGTAAVPPEVERQLLDLRYEQVFRVAGDDKYATAAAVAAALGTATTTATNCDDPTTADGDVRLGFYANSVVELRTAPAECQVLGRTVVLADGRDGIDALAAGWWTSFWQVPVLLHDGSDTLPEPTATALSTLQVDHVVVLGGASRIAESVVSQVAELTDAAVIRIAGSDRYETAVLMARQLGGWWPSAGSGGLPGSVLCVAASSGSGEHLPGEHLRGWPDALGAGPWCAAAAASELRPPNRALAPTNGPTPRSTAGSRPAAQAVPILLVPAGAAELPDPLRSLLDDVFPPDRPWCTSGLEPGAECDEPGFVVAVGGPDVVQPGAMARLVAAVGGTADPTPAGLNPQLGSIFATALDLSPVYVPAGGAGRRVCVERGGYADVRWIVADDDPSAAGSTSLDVMMPGWYQADADGVARTPGVGAPVCLALPAADGVGALEVRGVSLAGRSSPAVTMIPTTTALGLTSPAAAVDLVLLAGIDTVLDPDGGGSSRLRAVAAATGVELRHGTSSSPLDGAMLELEIVRGGSPSQPDVFSATWTLETGEGAVAGTAVGEAVLVGGTWHLRGRSRVTGGPWGTTGLTGGFVADLVTGGDGIDDDEITWDLDGLVPG